MRKEKELTEKFEYDDHLSFIGNVRVLLKGKIAVDIKDLERWIYLLKHDFTRYYIETEIKKYMEKEKEDGKVH